MDLFAARRQIREPMIGNCPVSRFYVLRVPRCFAGLKYFKISSNDPVQEEKMRRRFAMNMTRRVGRLLNLSLLVLTPALLLAQPALAEHRHLYVDAAARQNGDGSRHRPFWRITNAVARARELRQDDSDPEERIFIHVRPGTYVGSYDPVHLANNPRLELLPIVINVPDLASRAEPSSIRMGMACPPALIRLKARLCSPPISL